MGNESRLIWAVGRVGRGEGMQSGFERKISPISINLVDNKFNI